MDPVFFFDLSSLNLEEPMKMQKEQASEILIPLTLWTAILEKYAVIEELERENAKLRAELGVTAGDFFQMELQFDIYKEKQARAAEKIEKELEEKQNALEEALKEVQQKHEKIRQAEKAATELKDQLEKASEALEDLQLRNSCKIEIIGGLMKEIRFMEEDLMEQEGGRKNTNELKKLIDQTKKNESLKRKVQRRDEKIAKLMKKIEKPSQKKPETVEREFSAIGFPLTSRQQKERLQEEQ